MTDNDKKRFAECWVAYHDLVGAARPSRESLALAFELLKRDGVSGAPLANVSFQLLDEAGKVVSLAQLSDGSYRPADTVKHLPTTAPAKSDGEAKDALYVVKTTDTLVTDEQGKARVGGRGAGDQMTGLVN